MPPIAHRQLQPTWITGPAHARCQLCPGCDTGYNIIHDYCKDLSEDSRRRALLEQTQGDAPEQWQLNVKSEQGTSTMTGHTNELRIRGKRFILLPKREFETLKRLAEVGAKPAHRHKPRRSGAKSAARTRKTLRILDQWLRTEDRPDEDYWKSLEVDVALNRFRLRPPKD